MEVGTLVWRLCIPTAPADAVNIRERIHVYTGDALAISDNSFPVIWPTERIRRLHPPF